jgi:hypothetical protein
MKFDLRFLALWVTVGFVLAVVVGGASGVLGWLGGQRPAIAVLTGGGAFGGTIALYLLLLKLFIRPAP